MGKSAITFLAPGEFRLSRGAAKARILKPPELVLALRNHLGNRKPAADSVDRDKRQLCRSHVLPLVNDVVFHPYLHTDFHGRTENAIHRRA